MIGVDEYADRASPVHRWDPRYKIVGLAAVVFAIASVRDLRLVPVVLALAAALVALARLPWSFVLTRLRYPGVFVLALGALLPLLSGSTVLVALGPIAIREEGVLAFLLIAGRFAAILTVALVMFGTASILTSITALRGLGVPAVMTDMALLAYRYLHVLGDALVTMHRAARLRGFTPRAGRSLVTTLSTLSRLLGSLFVRSYERAERLHHAMILRGYGQEIPARHHLPARRADVGGLVAALLVAAGIVVVPLVMS